MIPQLRAPIVLVHGLLGFDRIRIGGCPVADYFPGIPEAIEAGANRVLMASLSPTGGIVDRAIQLKHFLERHSPGEPVHILAHSLGGLDSRYMISRLGMASRVLSLTTLGTPHQGTSFASWGIRRLGPMLKPIFDMLGVVYQAFYDLTVESVQKLNEETPDAPGVRYFSVAGKFRSTWKTPQWHFPGQILLKTEGENDGVVSVASATYGEDCQVWESDHLGLVNWCHPLAPLRRRAGDRIPLYARLLQRLRDEGF